MIAEGISTGGAERNYAYVEPLVMWGSTSMIDRTLLVDPQTSGGLLLAIPATKVDEYLARFAGAVRIGDVLAPSAHAIALT